MHYALGRIITKTLLLLNSLDAMTPAKPMERKLTVVASQGEVNKYLTLVERQVCHCSRTSSRK